jgi:hypothetical protein
MPGTDDLRNANQARLEAARAARSAVKAPDKEKEKAKSKQDEEKNDNRYDGPVSNHRSLLGANYSILQALESIKFSPGNDGGMYNDTAYIQLWKRGSTRETQAEAGTGDGIEPLTSFDGLGFFTGDLPPIQGVDLTKTSTLVASGAFNNKLDPFFNKDLNLNSSYGGSYTLSQNATATNIATQKNLGGAVPSTKDTSTPNPTTGTPPPAPEFFPTKKVSGPIKNANPGGGNGIGGALRTALGYAGNLTLGSYGKTGTTGIIPDANACLARGIWQFLFNPEEIDWEGGPEYGEAETWGVMGQSNSGKPLFWKNMKNEKLTFSKVLLNGYVFGKRVDSLEKGLKDLFYSESGDNPSGPPVLEFVWKEKRFGPCVIRDVRIKEKNWDGGVLVNAEVSFTLEKIPEWIVNDGYVDVARPSAQPVVGDVFAAPGKAGDSAAGADTNTNTNTDTSSSDSSGSSGKPNSPATKKDPNANRELIRKCNLINGSKRNFDSLSALSDQLKFNAIEKFGFFGLKSFISPDELISKYRGVYNKVDRSFYISKYMPLDGKYSPSGLSTKYEKCQKDSLKRLTGTCVSEFKQEFKKACYQASYVTAEGISNAVGCTPTGPSRVKLQSN